MMADIVPMSSMVPHPFFHNPITLSMGDLSDKVLSPENLALLIRMNIPELPALVYNIIESANTQSQKPNEEYDRLLFDM